ncbi:MAG: oxidoreductase [Acidobacteria bacterium]|nr:MAG: oxidoreductase [Acidobacteriota bacterium]
MWIDRLMMSSRLSAALVAALLGGLPVGMQKRERAMPDVRLMTVDPGHFHAALVQKEMYPGVSERVDVYAPLGPDLTEHLNRIVAFNTRTEQPTMWAMEVHASPDFFQRMLRERPGNVVVLSGRNRGKIARILASVRAGLHVLGDKPWILTSDDLPVLEAALAEADARGVVSLDIMTERFEPTNSLQRELVNDPATFGEIVRGTAEEPAVYMESVHYLKKVVAGAPNIRPPWFFDTAEQGEGFNDIGTHLVDLAQWTLFPGRTIDYHADVHVLAAQRWPTWIPVEDFRSVTNEARFPESIAASVKEGRLEYFCNTLVSYSLRGIYTKLNVIWDWEPPAGSGDTHFAFYRGTRARIEVRQTRADRFRPELYVVPAAAAMKAQVLAAVRARLEALKPGYPGIGHEDRGAEIHITIPDSLRLGHEAHFAQVTGSFLTYLRDRRTLPAWERPNMLAKYYVTTKGTELSREGPSRPAPRIAPR